MTVKVSGNPTVTITDSGFIASVPVTESDGNGWVAAQTILLISGLESDTAAIFLTNLKAAVKSWQDSRTKAALLSKKLGALEGKTL